MGGKDNLTPTSRAVCCQYDCKNLQVGNCMLCRDGFCKEHMASRICGIIDHNDKSLEYQIFVEDRKKEGGHPCPEYYSYLKMKEEERAQIWKETLDKLTLHSKRGREAKGVIEEEEYKKPSKKNIDWLLYILLGLLLGFCIYLLYIK